MSDFLEEKRREIEQRLSELKPLVDEYHRLEAASHALSGVDGSRPAAAPAAAAPATGRATRAASTAKRAKRAKRASAAGSTTSAGTAAATPRRRGRPKGSGTRAAEALALVKERPGITIPEMAEAMGIKQNYLYRVVPDLAKDGKLAKSGRGWHVRD